MIKKKYNQCYDVSEKNKTYLQTSIKRSKGIFPEMEVAKAHMKILKKYIKKDDAILDAGCLTGHFYRSFLRKFKNHNLKYTGIDPWALHINEAKKIWSKDKNVNFKKGWIQKLPFKNNSFDISICSNVLTHIPSIEDPIKELLRVTRKIILIRTPIHKISYRIQMVFNSKWFKFTNVHPKDEFDKKGNPRAFEYFDVHSKDYFKSLVKKYEKRARIKFIKDNFYNKKNINLKMENKQKILSTRVNSEGDQVADLLIIPNHFVLIKK
jgi:ubiquinone/menaquinone biosynthesis C-methylase UbiE